MAAVKQFKVSSCKILDFHVARRHSSSIKHLSTHKWEFLELTILYKYVTKIALEANSSLQEACASLSKARFWHENA